MCHLKPVHSFILCESFIGDNVAPMAPAKNCLQLAGSPLLRDAFRFPKLLRQYSYPVRLYSANSESAKPRPYNGPPKPKPLVATRSQAPPLNSSSIPSSSPNAKPPPNATPKSGGIYAPYWRISLGVVLCGSLIYSMVPFVPPNSIPKLTYMHASSPPPSSSKPLQSPTETPSQSANPA